ncbi:MULTISPECIES: preprotein translocase subunit SecG [Candidatus Ichthyocystis]|uniref:preprotein translocase subunit SecG n=1 Tax=Candidatus Ichthyocystis TaxID=2929841 RepID=UPI000A7281D6|nr:MULTISPECIES: preprotein translocase subunit SecG [Ichthyocystis]
MGFLLGLIVSLHVFVSVTLVVLVLLQQGKGSDAGAAFGAGSGASGTLFGAAGSGSFLSRLTSSAVTVFFLTSLTLSYLVSHQGSSVNQSVLDRSTAVSSVASVRGGTVSSPPIETIPNSKPSPAEQKKG